MILAHFPHPCTGSLSSLKMLEVMVDRATSSRSAPISVTTTHWSTSVWREKSSQRPLSTGMLSHVVVWGHLPELRRAAVSGSGMLLFLSERRTFYHPHSCTRSRTLSNSTRILVRSLPVLPDLPGVFMSLPACWQRRQWKWPQMETWSKVHDRVTDGWQVAINHWGYGLLVTYGQSWQFHQWGQWSTWDYQSAGDAHPHLQTPPLWTLTAIGHLLTSCLLSNHNHFMCSYSRRLQNLWWGYLSWMVDMRIFSTRWSVSVTKSAGELFSFTFFCWSNAVRMI